MTYAKHTMFEKFLEKFKIILKTGNESLGIPVLDPFYAKQISIKLDQNKNEEIIKCVLFQFFKIKLY